MITHGFRLLPGQLEEWSQGQGFLPLRYPSGTVQRESRWAKVLVVLVGTSEGYKWVAQWWETIYDDSSIEENLNLLLCLAWVETSVDLKR